MTSYELSSNKILRWREERLKEGGIASEVDFLLDQAGGLSWSELQKLHMSVKSKYSLHQSLEELEIIWHKYLFQNIPLQYLIGHCSWRDFELEVTSSVLIPRQETELLIDLGLKKIGDQHKGLWVDLGTGSGALAIALARAIPDWEGHAVDCSRDALLLAEKNLKKIAPDKDVIFHLGNWWQPLKPIWGLIDLVLANPPYIPNSLINNLEPLVREHEPHLALDGGEDGLEACREIICGSINTLSSGGWLIIEHHHDQSEKILKMMFEVGLKDLDFEKDLQGIIRFAMGRCP